MSGQPNIFFCITTWLRLEGVAENQLSVSSLLDFGGFRPRRASEGDFDSRERDEHCRTSDILLKYMAGKSPRYMMASHVLPEHVRTMYSYLDKYEA